MDTNKHLSLKNIHILYIYLLSGLRSITITNNNKEI